MLDCLIVGDSIAVGTHRFKPECVVYAKGGINSKQWVDKNIQNTPLQAKTVIISLGSNDHKYVKTENELQTVRQLTKADRVYWILPAIKPDIQEIVKKVAAQYGDVVLPITRLQPDGIHPSWAGYKELAEKAK
jgi:lysophospholipase L1-like esterase